MYQPVEWHLKIGMIVILLYDNLQLIIPFYRKDSPSIAGSRKTSYKQSPYYMIDFRVRAVYVWQEASQHDAADQRAGAGVMQIYYPAEQRAAATAALKARCVFPVTGNHRTFPFLPTLFLLPRQPRAPKPP